MGLTFEQKHQLIWEYGPDAISTPVGGLLIVHLDRPAEATIRKRITGVQQEAQESIDDCPLCEMERLRGGYTVVYYGDSLPEGN